MKAPFILLLALILPFSSIQDELEDKNTVASFKAAFLFQFAVSNNWDDNGGQSEFTIGVIGDQYVFDELLDKYATKPVGSQSLSLRFMEGEKDIEGIQMLYISNAFFREFGESEVKKWVDAVSGKPILIVTDQPNGLALGSAINFKVVDNRIRYEANTSQAKNNGITLGSKIISWAIQD
ncbi:MAG: YfiR family protein [Flavobacteriales bacterium]|nr:YfiR family protein [Flavobacteriales bacterium]